MYRLLFVIILCGCSVSNQSGRELSAAAIEQVTPGMAKPQVISLLGEPQNTFIAGSMDIWRYSFVKVNMTIMPLVGGANTQTQTVQITFGDDKTVMECIVALGHSANGVVEGGASGGSHEVHCSDINKHQY